MIIPRFIAVLSIFICFNLATSSSLQAQSNESSTKTNETEKGIKIDVSESGDSTSIRIGGIEVDVNENADSTRIKIGGIDIVVREGGGDDNEISIERNKEPKKLNKIKTRWGLVDIGVNAFIDENGFQSSNAPDPFNLNHGRSISLDIHLFRQRISLIKHHVNFMYGLGFSFDHYNFADQFTLLHDQPELTFAPQVEGIDFKKNKLRTTSVMIPLLLNFETNPKKPSKSFHLTGGVYGELMLKGKTKQKTTDKVKTTVKDDFNINKFSYGFMGQIGVGAINFYAKYSMTPLFKESAYQDIQPITFGITIVPF